MDLRSFWVAKSPVWAAGTTQITTHQTGRPHGRHSAGHELVREREDPDPGRDAAQDCRRAQDLRLGDPGSGDLEPLAQEQEALEGPREARGHAAHDQKISIRYIDAVARTGN